MMYDQIARFYDLTHASLQADIPLVRKLAQAAEGPVLEMGCGSGRLLLPLARAGVTVTGVDQSPAMLARARRRLLAEPASVQQRVTLVEADMTQLDLPEGDGRFPLILISYNTFLHLDNRQALAALGQVRAYLAENGRLFIDLINPVAVSNTPEDQLISLENHLVDPETGDIILHIASNRLDAAGQILHVTWIYDVSPAAGGSIQRTVTQTTYHYRFPHQMELLLAEAGLKLARIAGDYDEGSFTEDSERLLVWAEKA